MLKHWVLPNNQFKTHLFFFQFFGLMLIISEVIGKDFLLEMHDKGNVGDDYADNDKELLEQIPRYFFYLKDDMSLKICFQFRLLHAICKPKKASSCRKQDHSEV